MSNDTVKLTAVDYELGMRDMHEYLENSILKALENPDIDKMPASMALRVLLAAMRLKDEE